MKILFFLSSESTLDEVKSANKRVQNKIKMKILFFLSSESTFDEVKCTFLNEQLKKQKM